MQKLGGLESQPGLWAWPLSRAPALTQAGLQGLTKVAYRWAGAVMKFQVLLDRTSAFQGRCPALSPLLHLITSSRASGTADHVRSLDD